MTRIKDTFAALGSPALVTFIMSGDGGYDKSLDLLKALPDAGADIIELGMPFSDPMADGAQIAAAGKRALDAGADMHKTLDMVREFRKSNDKTPIVLMGYANPVLKFENFCKTASNAGVDGLIIVDMPPEEEGDFVKSAKNNKIDVIHLIAPTTSDDRLPLILNTASGFIYYVSIAGITGAAKADKSAVKSHVQKIKSYTDLPIAVGFGVKTPQDAREMAQSGANAIVVGSSIVQSAHEKGSQEAIALVASLKKAIML